MSSAKYDEKRNGFWLSFKDFQKEKAGVKHPYGKKFITDKFYPHLPKKAKERRMAEMVNEAARLENATITQIDYSGRNRRFIAWEYFANVEKVSGSTHPTTVERNRWVVNTFVDWLKANYPKLYLHELSRQIAEEYITSLRATKALTTVKTFSQVLSWIMKRVLVATEDSDLKYRNPFENFDFSVIEHEAKVRKAIFTVEQMKQLLEPLPPTNMSKTGIYRITHEIFYILFATGWRISDVCSINPSTDVDWEKRTLTHIHGKTQKRGTRTVLYLTDRLYNFLLERKDQPSLWPKYKLHSLRKAALARINALGFKEMYTKGKATFNAYCVHSTRGTVITWLKNANFNNDRINYLVGHCTQSVEGRSYNKFDYSPKEATEDLSLYLEKIMFD